tara:strand:+ start:98 stop:895 length:798 start_codon:yes stop_codon:yes gene_type:complete
MEIGIVGIGVVGSAIKHGFEKLGHKTYVHDIKINTKIEDVCKSEIVFICVPTPSKANGDCDTVIVESVISDLSKLHYGGLVAIKSTVKPGTTERLISNFPNLNISFVPEFLRERCAIADFLENHDLCVIGTDNLDAFSLIKKAHGKYPKNFVHLSTTEAEFVKYFNNVYNAMLITFANNFYDICTKMGADYSKIKNAVSLRDNIVDKYLDCNDNFRGFGGVCLPKDTKALVNLGKELGLNGSLFETLINENQKYKTTVFEGMRKS